MARYAKRNIIATASLMAGLAACTFSGAKALEIFPQEMESALSDNPENRPQNLPYEQRNASFVAGIGFFAVAARQRVKHVAEMSLAKQQDNDEQLEEIEILSYCHEDQLAVLALQHYGAENEAEAEIITLGLEQPESDEELAVVIDLSSRHRDPPPTQPPINPDFTSVA